MARTSIGAEAMLDPLQRLVEIAAIERLKARYLYFVDYHDWAEWVTLLTPDATFQFDAAVSTGGRDGQPSAVLPGSEAIANFLRTYTREVEHVHQAHTPLIDFTSDTEARGVWGLETLADAPEELRHSYGHYHETYRKVDGEWKFSSIYVTWTRRHAQAKPRLLA
jgi:hypothetical protein